MNNDAVAVPWFGQIVVYVQIKMAADGDGQLWFNINGILRFFQFDVAEKPGGDSTNKLMYSITWRT